jgi:hypothetical protein
MRYAIGFGFRIRANGAQHNKSPYPGVCAIVDKSNRRVLVDVDSLVRTRVGSRTRGEDDCIHTRQELRNAILDIPHYGRHPKCGKLHLLAYFSYESDGREIMSSPQFATQQRPHFSIRTDY